MGAGGTKVAQLLRRLGLQPLRQVVVQGTGLSPVRFSGVHVPLATCTPWPKPQPYG